MIFRQQYHHWTLFWHFAESTTFGSITNGVQRTCYFPLMKKHCSPRPWEWSMHMISSLCLWKYSRTNEYNFRHTPFPLARVGVHLLTSDIILTVKNRPLKRCNFFIYEREMVVVHHWVKIKEMSAYLPSVWLPYTGSKTVFLIHWPNTIFLCDRCNNL